MDGGTEEEASIMAAEIERRGDNWIPNHGRSAEGGHTDNQGGAAGNQKLSQSRAEAVRAFLIKQGVKAAMLTSKGYGETKAVASNDTEEGRFKNRRIEFSVVK